MKTTLISLYAETAIHAGAGSSTGIIDLPIMREAHTGYPCIFGSAMKGAFRAYCEQKIADRNKIKNIFGTEANENRAWAGALTMGDAKLLLLPVRSLTTHFRWVSCPAILKRLQKDLKRAQLDNTFQIPEPIDDTYCLTFNSSDDFLYLEEYRYRCDVKEQKEAEELLNLLNYLMPNNIQVNDQITLVSDNQFAHLSQIATVVTPHIAIDNEQKTVKPGALWYEETLPADTVMYTILSTESTRNKDGIYSEQAIQDDLFALFESYPYLQIGGNETVGMGWMHLQFFPKSQEEKSHET